MTKLNNFNFMLSKFHTLYFESTRNCNFNCKYCSSGSNVDKIFPDISYDKIIKHVLEPAYELGTRFIDFSGGEFLLRKDFLQLLAKANELGYIIGIASNGSMLTDEVLEKIQSIVGENLIISLGINSFDLANAETRDVETEYTLKILERIKKYNFRINISVTIGDFNKESFAKTVKSIRKMHLPFNRIPFVPRSCNAYDLMFNKESLRDYLHPELVKFFNGQVSYTPYMLPQEVYEKVSGQNLSVDKIPLNPSVGCWVGAYYAINAEGEVAPCPMFLDHVSGGNVYKIPLKEILNESELFQQIIDRNNLEGKCGNCKYTYTCGGCRVMAYYYTGNVYAEDPTCFLHELSDKEIKKKEEQIIESFKNYVRMAKFGHIFHK